MSNNLTVARTGSRSSAQINDASLTRSGTVKAHRHLADATQHDEQAAPQNARSKAPDATNMTQQTLPIVLQADAGQQQVAQTLHTPIDRRAMASARR